VYLTSVTELDAALTDCWRRLCEARDTENIEAGEVYLAQLDRLLDMRLRLADGGPATDADESDGPLAVPTRATRARR